MNRRTMIPVVVVLVTLGLLFDRLNAQTQPFFPPGTYKEDVPKPETVLGFKIGEQPVRHHQVVRYLRKLADSSPRVQFFESGETHEKRLLCYVVISSEKNMSNLESFRQNISTIADPRQHNSTKELIDSTPAVAWMMYSIHGDEFSGVDAAVQLAYRLAAGTDDKTIKILNELIIGIDPMENPDGRERYLAQMQQWGGVIPNSDAQSIQHSGVWPWGRGNHYLFDLNRDWFILAHPESRARIKTMVEWKPQLVVDAHEMGAYDTYLFNPPREPINTNISATVRNWWNIFSEGQAKAFDKYGWSYYTREWYDDWYPGYGSSWPGYTGAVGLLYEQASTDGSLIKRPDGTLSKFSDAVFHQFVSSIANLETAAENRSALLKDFVRLRKQATNLSGAFYIDPTVNPGRAQKLIERLLMQGIEVEVCRQRFTIKGLQSYRQSTGKSKTLPQGTYVIRLGQPYGFLIKAILEFDPRMLTSVLQKEHEDLEKGKGTHLYEVTSWSMLMAYDVEAYYAKSLPNVRTERVTQIKKSEGNLVSPESAVAYLCEYQDDRAINALLLMFEKGLKIRVAKEPFKIEKRTFKRGTLLLRTRENSDNLTKDLAEIAVMAGLDIYGVKTQRSQDGPDLGGQEFELLTEPRIAVLSGPGLSGYNVGATWYLLDYELQQRFSLLNHNYFNQVDLRKYNVLVLPSIWGSIKTYHRIFGKSGIKKIKDWVKNGGTLIGINNSAAFLADSSTAISKVRLRRQALKELPMFNAALEKEKTWRTRVDSLAVWEGTETPAPLLEEKSTEPDSKKLKELDNHQRLYQPRGAILRVELDEESWINFGLHQQVPAIFYSSFAFLSKKPIQTAARFAAAPQLRISGLVWPEARQRWANTAYVTREAHGNGQIILFAGEPNFRSYFYGTTRMLLNSLLLGPGMGARETVDW